MVASRTSPDLIQEIQPGEIFVFGSNMSGIHGAGAAKLALNKFGAKLYQGIGFQGQSYAIPTKDFTVLKSLTIDEISLFVDKFTHFAQANPFLTFLVTEIGCGYAGYSPENIAPLFKKANKVENIHLPKSFWKILLTEEYQEEQDEE